MAPAYSRLEALDAEFGEKAGWERELVPFEQGSAHEAHRPRGWAGEQWSTAIVAEHLAVRERAALFDETSFAKFEVSGPGALDLLQRLCANDVDARVGRVVYTQMLNRQGGIESDLTVTRLAPDVFRMITGTASGSRDLASIRKHEGSGAVIRDATSSLACLGIWGPAAREVLVAICDEELSNGAFPYMTAREVDIGDVPCLAARVRPAVGELDRELCRRRVGRAHMGHGARGRAPRPDPRRIPGDGLACGWRRATGPGVAT